MNPTLVRHWIKPRSENLARITIPYDQYLGRLKLHVDYEFSSLGRVAREGRVRPFACLSLLIHARQTKRKRNNSQSRLKSSSEVVCLKNCKKNKTCNF